MKTTRKIIIVGGVADGASAAAKARRVDEKAEIHIFERGPYISFANELPRDRRILAYCQKGQRGYLAACALHGHGFDAVANLRGGFLQAKLNGL